MRFVTVQAHAFGPLSERTLQLSPGFTVIYGPNESGKSSWHAAIYAGLCGVRRGRGLRKPEREFANQYKPWHDDRWEVTVTVRLDDGREITIHQDLAGKVDSRAADELGRDVSSEIIYEGAPDGARWFGLDRRTFLVTACVRQADVLGVLEDPSLLQTTLQAAAATASVAKDATAAAAIRRIEAYRSDHVGLDRANSRKPLRAARVRLEEAIGAREAADAMHQGFLQVSVRSQQLRLIATAADQKVRAAEALVADCAARVAEERVAKAGGFSRKFPDGAPQAFVKIDELARDVATATQAWNDRPAVPELDGLSAAELIRQLEALPSQPEGDQEPAQTIVEFYNAAMAAQSRVQALNDLASEELASRIKELPAAPEGDTEPEREVEDAFATFIRAQSKVEASLAEAPPDLEAIDHAALEPRELRELADDLERAIPQTTGDEVDALSLANTELTELQAPSTTYRALAGAGVAIVVLGVGLALAVLRVGVPLIALGLLAAGFGLWKQSQRNNRRLELLATIASMEARLSPNRHRAAEARERQEKARRRLFELELPDDAERVRDLADLTANHIAAAQRREAWSQHQNELEESLAEAREGFFAALESRGESAESSVDPPASFKAYRDRVRQRSKQAEEAAERARLEADLKELRAAEESFQAAEGAVIKALSDHGEETADHFELEEAYATYREHCKERAQQGTAAARRGDLKAQLKQRERAEATRAANLGKREEGDEALRDVAQRCGLDFDPGPALISALEKWQAHRIEALKENDQALRDWAELKALLDGKALAELIEATREQRLNADHLLEKVDATVLESMASEPSEAQLRSLRLDSERLTEQAAKAEGAVLQRSAALPSVPEAEVESVAAREKLKSVEHLDATLVKTLEFLREAEDRIHRSIAPVLSKSVAPRLPQITAGRYAEVRVDPEDLAVDVRASGGQWRDATRLSTGTAEQVYLLLRMAMAEHLVTTDESCPLLLDDVTVQSDADRTVRIMETLHEASSERQVIMFSQEAEVAAWAEEKLNGANDSFQQLDAALILP